MLSATVVAAASLLLAILMYVLFFRRSRRFPNEPPLDTGFIPWLGHAIEFGRDAATFLSKMKQKHGDIFTVRAAGRYVTVLLDPHSYDAVVWESSSNLDFNKYAKTLMERMFRVQLPNYDPAEEKVMMRVHLQNKSLSTLTKAMFSNLKNILLDDTSRSSKEWKEEGLFHLSYSVMVRAGFLTLFGNDSAKCDDPALQAQDRELSNDVYEGFQQLDKHLMKAARCTLTTEEKKEMASAQNRLWELLSVKKLNFKSNRSSWLESYQRHLESLGVGEEMQSRAMLLQLWSTQGNAGPAAFWLLAFLLKNPDALAEVKGELQRILKSKAHTIEEQEATSQEVLDSAHIFDSVLNETLRLTAAPFITREVLQDMVLKLADGREYSLRKGDRLCLFPYISPQMDPDIYQDPENFQYDRFLNSDGSEKTDFFKRGKKLKQYTMPWGAGKNACIGRFHAINSIKQFVFILLTCFDLELKTPEEKLPSFDKSRYGFGMVQPISDIMIRYKLKEN
ncbi:prostacyclin synthase isoform X2 [Ambystoma mexicanum]|uniref:prostacyclin synthase isoform X2 n=1 Tax=Ambystoma mexicanum TaxID=8296 RepID=UPI0037E8F97A